MMAPGHDELEVKAQQARPKYEPPRVTQMNEEELLAAFQVTQASITWWMM